MKTALPLRVTPEAFRAIRDQVHTASGIWLGEDKAYLVETRLASILPAVGLADFDALRCALERPGAVALRRTVVEALTTGETSWFRDEHPFRAVVEAVLPGLHAEGRRFRFWSAACSTGQEPYSLAIAALEFYAALGGAVRCRERLEIVGTDLSEGALEVAAAGVYDGLQTSRGLSPARRQRYFLPEGRAWRIAEEVRDLVRFQPVNLLQPLAHLGSFDVVFLRNVTIYFTESTKAAVLQAVTRCLRPGGYLFLGAAESFSPPNPALRRLQHGATCYFQRQE